MKDCNGKEIKRGDIIKLLVVYYTPFGEIEKFFTGFYKRRNSKDVISFTNEAGNEQIIYLEKFDETEIEIVGNKKDKALYNEIKNKKQKIGVDIYL